MIGQAGVGRVLGTILRHPAKLWNLVRVGLSFLLTRSRIWGYPPVLILETTTYCQLRCPLCIREHPRFDRGNIHLSLEAIDQLLKECGRQLCLVLLYNQGEPFLHPDVLKIIRLFKSYGVIVKISTNGNFSSPSPKELIDSGCDHVIFDVDGDTQETYERYRVGGSLDRLMENIRGLAEERRRRSARVPFIEARLIAMPHNWSGVARVKDLVDTAGADTFTIKKCMVRDTKTFKGSAAFIPDDFNRVGVKIPKKCRYPWIFSSILVNGTVSPCCYDELGAFGMGNIHQKTLRSILDSPEYLRARGTIRRAPQDHPLCKQCDIEGDFYLDFDAWEKRYGTKTGSGP